MYWSTNSLAKEDSRRHGLDQAGKLREYLLGELFRKRYNNLLGSLYVPSAIDPVTTEVNRAKMSLLLVLGAMFPPEDTPLEWNVKLNWQPIPYRYLSFATDRLLTVPGYFCPNYKTLHDAYLSSPEGQAVVQKYSDLFPYISKHSGLDVKSVGDLALLYFCLKAEEEFGLPLPHWTKKVYPEYLTNAAIDYYAMSAPTTQLKQLSGGFLLQKIIDDTEAKINNKLQPDRKMFLYSGHEYNVAFLLFALEVFPAHIPPYGSCVMIEVHEIDGVYGIKIFYENYSEPEPIALKVPGCDYFCPFEKFVKLIGGNLPTSDNMCVEDLTSNKLAK